MAASIEQVVRAGDRLDEIRDAGLALVVIGDEEKVVLRTDPPPGSRWPVIEAQLRGASWWSPEGMARAEQLAGRLSAELRMKWERWIAGD